MARLIDADALNAEVKGWKRQQHSMNIDYSTGYRCALSTVEGMIADAPTEDAIPVDWIRAKMDEVKREADKGIGNAAFTLAVIAPMEYLINEWQKEQEDDDATD